MDRKIVPSSSPGSLALPCSLLSHSFLPVCAGGGKKIGRKEREKNWTFSDFANQR